jgi:hypothetical protein
LYIIICIIILLYYFYILLLFLYNNIYLKENNELQGLTIEKKEAKWTSEYTSKHTKPKSDEEFGHYLAGLIDGDGSIQEYRIRICFYILDLPSATYIKNRLGYGKIIKIKGKNAYDFCITGREGIQLVLNLINGKLRTEHKYNAVITHIINKYKTPVYLKEKFQMNNSDDLNNHWLAGFIDADGSFQVKILKRRKNYKEIRVYLQIDQKANTLLILIRNKFGGYIGHRKSQDTYYYSSTSFGSAKKVIDYLDEYNMLSSKYLNYLKWRKVYELIQEKKHITAEGQEIILNIKLSMNSYSKETFNLET